MQALLLEWVVIATLHYQERVSAPSDSTGISQGIEGDAVVARDRAMLQKP
ncbi:hypothetical protein XM38_011140 [Halomicronema hongdechloris C2206]|uniref:Uncharacterized protein n=1 Tax=Halomicronema hongdechloris C2206 TaxID=1641165 RepID=A0A1Z3HIP0_9CYAN|nr:hypothetical protein XM38_011140 [Halomicronema hongdechloris C2206]